MFNKYADNDVSELCNMLRTAFYDGDIVEAENILHELQFRIENTGV